MSEKRSEKRKELILEHLGEQRRPRVAILHSQIPEQGAAKDDLDIMVQVEAIAAALSRLGCETALVPFSLDLERVAARLQAMQPALVFNLVEMVNGYGQLIHLAPSLLDSLRLPYTGSGTEALFLTSNKLLAKKILKASGIPTPPWIRRRGEQKGEEPKMWAESGPWIIKSVWEHASAGLDESSVIDPAALDDPFHHLCQRMERYSEGFGRDCFAEKYIDGREFNLSLLADESSEPWVLPVAEIRFDHYPDGRWKIVDYRAKWDEESFEYQHTNRRFDFPDKDRPLLERLSELAKRCWQLFELSGYARVDFRVDQEGNPWVLEVNANPCLSPDSGFVAAAKQAGLSFDQLIQRIITPRLSKVGKWLVA